MFQNFKIGGCDGEQSHACYERKDQPQAKRMHESSPRKSPAGTTRLDAQNPSAVVEGDPSEASICSRTYQGQSGSITQFQPAGCEIPAVGDASNAFRWRMGCAMLCREDK